MRNVARSRVRRLWVVPTLAAASVLAGTTAQAVAPPEPVTPIPQDPSADSVVPFLGTAREAHPVDPGERAPRHPFMARNGRSNIHEDAYQSDASPFDGPLGQGPRVTSTFVGSECASVTFDSRGRIVTVCVGAAHPTLRLVHPHTLETLASYPLPPRQPQTVPSLFTSFGGGGYFYLDHEDRAVVPTNDGHLYVLRVDDSGSGPTWRLDRDYDVTAETNGQAIVSALPDWSGRLWFVTDGGVVGVVDPASGRVSSTRLPDGETVSNSFAVDETGGVFIVSSHALYRFDAGPGDSPDVTWRQPYDRGTRVKPGQTQQGSGTTPTIIRRGLSRFVAITDNADPRMHVLVFRAGRDGPGARPVCSEPVFAPGEGATDNSLISVGRSLVVENNYGYSGPVARPPEGPTRLSPTTEPGVTRVDVDLANGGCRTAWMNDTVRVPSSVSKASPATGLLYVYSHPAASEVRYRSGPLPTGNDPGNNPPSDRDPWYLTALDLRTGRVAWSRLTGTGTGYNNHYAPVTLGPTGTAYIGALGGLIAVRDTGGGSG